MAFKGKAQISNPNMVWVKWKQHSYDHSPKRGPSHRLSVGKIVKNCTSENLEAGRWRQVDRAELAGEGPCSCTFPSVEL